MAAVILMLDAKGTSDRVLRRLKELNICKGPNDARAAIRKAATLLDLPFVFPSLQGAGGAELVPALGFSGDNADIYK